MLNTVSYAHSLKSHPLFESYNDLWQPVLQKTSSKTYHKGEIVAQHGDAANTLWLILKGWVKLSRYTPDGKETILGLSTENDIFGEAALFQYASYPQTIEAITEVELIAFPAQSVRALIHEHPELSTILMKMLGTSIAKTQLQLEHRNTLSAPQRLGCFFLRLCHAKVTGTHRIHIPIEKHLLASYLGMKPETLSRAFHQLKSVGVEVAGAEVILTNIERLNSFVCESCSESGMCDSETSALMLSDAQE